MRKLLTSLVVLAGMGLLVDPSALAQGTPDGETPANEGVCDHLLGLTPGLYGLCVAFCEAVDCEATYDPATGEVTFDPSCKPSSPKVLEKYNARKAAGDPAMPCVKTSCPCWTDAELDEIADGVTFSCEAVGTVAIVFGLDAQTDMQDFAAVSLTGSVPQLCVYNEQTPGLFRFEEIGFSQRDVCVQSILAECDDRGF